MNQFEYFVFSPEICDDYPIVNEQPGEDLDFYYRHVKVNNPDPILMNIDEPYPVNLKMVDLLSPVLTVSSRLKHVFDYFELVNIQFIPVIIKGINGDIYQDYWLMNITKTIRCLDLERSEYEDINKFGDISGLNKIVLDDKKLNDIPQQERMIFKIEETYLEILIHKSIAEAIKNESFKGVKIYSLDEYHEDIQWN